MMQQETPDDFVVSTGEQHSVREFVEICGSYFGMNIEWQGTGLDEIGIDTVTGLKVIGIDKNFFRPAEVSTLLGDSTKARTVLNWKPKYSFGDLVREMCESELSK
jgi:GDPmannose 4,6-dehydratase